MARLKLTGTLDPAWLDTDALVVLVGTENAASLAASTPPGGTVVKTLSVAEAREGAAPTTYRIEYDYAPTDKCATLPVGIAAQDASGNRSAAVEDLIQVRDPPLGVDRPTASATANPNEATIAWALSTDVN